MTEITINKLTVGNALSSRTVHSTDIFIDNISVKEVLKKLPPTWVKSVNGNLPDQTGNISIEIPQITVDSELSETSENPVQNKVMTTSFIKKSGDRNIGTLQISGNFEVGSDNVLYSAESLTQGEANTVGYHACAIKEINISASTIQTWDSLLAWKSTLDSYKNKLISYKLYCNYITVAKLLSVNYDTNTISCTELPIALAGNDGVKNLSGIGEYQDTTGNGSDAEKLWFPMTDDGIKVGNSIIGTGCGTVGYGNYAFNWSFAEGCGSMAQGRYSHAEGNNTRAGYASHAEGRETAADSWCSHAAGARAYVKPMDAYSYVWNAGAYWDRPSYIPSKLVKDYYSHGFGTYNINPLSGLIGFYIGEDNFVQAVLSAVQMMTTEQKTALKNALSI